jgi:hypothetical protein
MAKARSQVAGQELMPSVKKSGSSLGLLAISGIFEAITMNETAAPNKSQVVVSPPAHFTNRSKAVLLLLQRKRLRS